MRKPAAGLAVLLSLSAIGSGPAWPAEPSLSYDRTKACFDSGNPPSMEDLTGWFAGRIHDTSDRTGMRSWPALLIGQEASKNGPGFDAKLNLVLFYNPKADQPPQYYEHMDQDRIRKIEARFKERLLYFTEVNLNSDGGMFLKNRESGEYAYNAQYEVRQCDGYIVMRETWVLRSGRSGADYAYFDKDVTPENWRRSPSYLPKPGEP